MVLVLGGAPYFIFPIVIPYFGRRILNLFGKYVVKSS
jgi:hypothetical protein